MSDVSLRKKALGGVVGSIGAEWVKRMEARRQPPAPPPTEEAPKPEEEFSDEDLRLLAEEYGRDAEPEA